MAMVMQDYLKELPIMKAIFDELEAAAHLSVNYNKCIFIPLFEHQEHRLRTCIREAAGAFEQMVICKSGKYLGFVIGPGKGDLY